MRFKSIRVCLLLVTVFFLAQVTPAWAGDVYALLVFDTHAENIGQAVEIDQKNLTTILRSAFGDKLHATVLDAHKATATQILDYYDNLKARGVKPDDVLLFFYSGHGGLFGKEYQLFHLHHPSPPSENRLWSRHDPISRLQIENRMGALGSRLNIILYDCCSNAAEPRHKPKDGGRLPRPSGKRENPKLINQLFFGSHKLQNWVIIGSTKQGTPSYCDNNTLGGFFTWAFVEALTSDIDSLDQDGDGIVTWRELFQSISKEVTKIEPRQQPEAFYLDGHKSDDRYLQFHNKTEEIIDVSVRWYGMGEFLAFDRQYAIGDPQYGAMFKKFQESRKWITITVEPGDTVRLEQDGKPVKVMDHQYIGIGRKTDTRWKTAWRGTGGTYDSGKDGSSVGTHTINLGFAPKK